MVDAGPNAADARGEGTRVSRVLAEREGSAAALIVAGSATDSRCLQGPRVLPVGDLLEIGRTTAESPCLPFLDVEVSRRHAQIVRNEGSYRLTDLGSTNGTFVDGVRVGKDGVSLRPGAVIGVGPYVFVFRRLAKAELGAITEDLASPFSVVATVSPQNAVLASRLKLMARANVDLLLSGETGVGKEVYAEAIHRASGRRGQFMAINCAAIPESLIESELYGYSKGAHSTALESKVGLMELAEGGTLFLDEIGDMPAQAQAKLLRFLQDRRFVPLGSTRLRTVDTRIVAATRRAVTSDRNDRSLRFDLAMRLGPEPLIIPSLRMHIEDLGGLVWHFLGARSKPFTWEAFGALFLYDWPGNIRELEKVIELAVVLAENEQQIRLDHLPDRIVATWRQRRGVLVPPGAGASDARVVTTVESAPPTRAELEGLLSRHRGDVAQVARSLGRQRTLVWRWLRKHGCDPDRFRLQA
jgi:transcriptional regulator with PAS, ATPase and Fis domain